MQTSYAPSSTSLTFKEVRTLALASLGGALEFYDFVIFVFFTEVIAKLFFPAGLSDWMRETQAFGVFATGYLGASIGWHCDGAFRRYTRTQTYVHFERFADGHSYPINRMFTDLSLGRTCSSPSPAGSADYAGNRN